MPLVPHSYGFDTWKCPACKRKTTTATCGCRSAASAHASPAPARALFTLDDLVTVAAMMQANERGFDFNPEMTSYAREFVEALLRKVPT